MKSFDFSSLWTPELPPWEVAFRAAFIYVFVQLVLRFVGRKELGRWSTSEIVLLFLISTAVRQSIVGSDTSLTSAMVGLGTIFGLDWMLSALTARSDRAAELVHGPVRQLVRDGELQRDMMRRTRVSEHELRAQARKRGHATLADVKDAYLERSGDISMIFRDR